MPEGFNLTTIAILIVVLYLLSSIKILAEYERGVIFRLGRVLPQPKGPGVILVFAPIDRMVRMSLRVETLEVPAQDVVTRDNVTVKVNAVIYFRVIEPTRPSWRWPTTSTRPRNWRRPRCAACWAKSELDELLSQREKLNVRLQSVLDQHTGPWGVKVAMVEVKQVDLPEQMIRAIARQAEAERERRAKIIHAEGEYARRRETRHGGGNDPAAAGGHPVALPADAGRNRRREEHDSCVPDPGGYIHVGEAGARPVLHRNEGSVKGIDRPNHAEKRRG